MLEPGSLRNDTSKAVESLEMPNHREGKLGRTKLGLGDRGRNGTGRR